MPLNVAGKPLPNGALVAGAGLIVALVDSFLPWRSASIPWGLVCSAVRQCVVETGAFNGSHSALVYWPGWVFFIAVLVGLVLLFLRTFMPQLTISPMPSTDAPVYAGIGVVMLLCALLRLLTGVGSGTEYYQTTAGGVYTLAPGIGVFIGIIAAAAVGVGGYLMRAEPQPATKPTGPHTSNA
jgi:hypothetical protein